MNKSVLFVLATLTLLTACSGIPQRDDENQTMQRYLAYAGDPVSGFSALGRIDGWRPLTRDKLIVWTGFNDAYLLSVEPSCMNLEFAMRIGLTTSVGSSVQSGFDYVRFRDGFRRERCRIVEIRPLDYRRMRQETDSHAR